MKNATEMPKKLTKEQKLVESIHKQRRLKGVNVEPSSIAAKELVIKQWQEDHPRK